MFCNRVFCTTATTGTGDVTVGSAMPAHCTPAEAGMPNLAERTWLLEEGVDFELFRGVYTTSGTVVTRGRVIISKIAGTVGTSRMTLAGGAVIREVASAEDLGPKKNHIINGGARVSQQNGSTAGTTNGYYPVDMFAMFFANAGTQTIQQVASITPGGSPYRIRVTATVADASVAAGDYLEIVHKVEGLDCSDLFLGTSSAKTLTLRFGVKGPAGTYCVSCGNGVNSRSYVAEYVISAGEANTAVVKVVTIALDQTGTWAIDNTAGLQISWTLMCGSTYQTTAGSWTAGNFIASSNQFNFMGTASNVFELFDIASSVSVVAPDFILEGYGTTLLACQRYYESGGAYASAISSEWANVCYKVTKRAAATVVTTLGGTVSMNTTGTSGFHVNTTIGITNFNFTADARM